MDYYKVLRVKPDASQEEITKAVERMLLIWHPDNYSDYKVIAECMFEDITEAQNVLTDPHKRKLYDEERNRTETQVKDFDQNSECKFTSGSGHHGTYRRPWIISIETPAYLRKGNDIDIISETNSDSCSTYYPPDSYQETKKTFSETLDCLSDQKLETRKSPSSAYYPMSDSTSDSYRKVPETSSETLESSSAQKLEVLQEISLVSPNLKFEIGLRESTDEVKSVSEKKNGPMNLRDSLNDVTDRRLKCPSKDNFVCSHTYHRDNTKSNSDVTDKKLVVKTSKNGFHETRCESSENVFKSKQYFSDSQLNFCRKEVLSHGNEKSKKAHSEIAYSFAREEVNERVKFTNSFAPKFKIIESGGTERDNFHPEVAHESISCATSSQICLSNFMDFNLGRASTLDRKAVSGKDSANSLRRVEEDFFEIKQELCIPESEARTVMSDNVVIGQFKPYRFSDIETHSKSHDYLLLNKMSLDSSQIIDTKRFKPSASKTLSSEEKYNLEVSEMKENQNSINSYDRQQLFLTSPQRSFSSIISESTGRSISDTPNVKRRGSESLILGNTNNLGSFHKLLHCKPFTVPRWQRQFNEVYDLNTTKRNCNAVASKSDDLLDNIHAINKIVDSLLWEMLNHVEDLINDERIRNAEQKFPNGKTRKTWNLLSIPTDIIIQNSDLDSHNSDASTFNLEDSKFQYKNGEIFALVCPRSSLESPVENLHSLPSSKMEFENTKTADQMEHEEISVAVRKINSRRTKNGEFLNCSSLLKGSVCKENVRITQWNAITKASYAEDAEWKIITSTMNMKTLETTIMYSFNGTGQDIVEVFTEGVVRCKIVNGTIQDIPEYEWNDELNSPVLMTMTGVIKANGNVIKIIRSHIKHFSSIKIYKNCTLLEKIELFV